ncbi:MAG: hypothetical protein MJZ66_02985 [Bacteroidales bacterium]|nr:hypothetical protein [Bacteroidales bacterium]
MENKSSYKWKYTKIGGVTRISIETGEDIAHLPELDQKQWTVLSCPSKGLEFDQKTLDYLDGDGDGHIRVNEVIAAIEWLNKVLKSPDTLTQTSSVINLDDINMDTDEGRKVYNSAKQILANLKLEKNEISLDDTADSTKIFAESLFNGDGIITEASADSDDLKKVIALIIDKIGKATDRSGKDGINKDLIEEFYTEAADFAAWKNGAEAVAVPYGDNTAAAKDAFCAIKDKVADYFIRCKLVALDGDTCPSLEIPKDKLAAIADKNLSEEISEISAYPLTRLSDKAVLPLNANINPAWEAKFAALKSLILDVDFAGKDSISEAEWNTIEPKFAAYEKWMADKKGAKVESIDMAELKAILEANQKDALLALIEKDLAEKDNAESIDAVNKFAHLYRDIYPFLRNYVTFSDFYQINSELKSIFQAGRLFIDQRECDLCIKVSDMGKHNATAALSNMYIAYCDCVNTKKGGKMTIAAVITDGDVENIAVGKNGIFYDRQGNDWDATITKIIENPISVRQAFWSPYKKLAKLVEEQINKFAASKEADMNKSMTEKVSESSTKLTTTPAEGAAPAAAAPEKPFDIAKFCGIFAAIGLAIGAIGAALAAMAKAFIDLPWWGMIIVIVGVLMLISGPSMLVAYMKLRRRNMSPLLNANGWAINAHTFVNITFGATLTKLAKFPILNVKDPLADKGTPWWQKAIYIVVILGAIFAALYFNNKLERFGLPYDNGATEAPAPAAEAPAAEAPAAE